MSLKWNKIKLDINLKLLWATYDGKLPDGFHCQVARWLFLLQYLATSSCTYYLQPWQSLAKPKPISFSQIPLISRPSYSSLIVSPFGFYINGWVTLNTPRRISGDPRIYVIYSIGGSTSCSSHIIFILAKNVFLCCHERSLSCWRPFHSDQKNTITLYHLFI